jgi:hypothetical protein
MTPLLRTEDLLKACLTQKTGTGVNEPNEALSE